jgi:L-fuconolactonase
MVTEANPKSWIPAQLRPYLDTVVEAFRAERLMAGTDWPVCLVGTSYSGWWDFLRGYFAEFSEEERASIFGGCAVKIYRLKIE